MQEKNEILKIIYKKLFEYYGPQHWWPGETKLEIIVGAILTQNTSWRNVEKSIEKLKFANMLNFESLLNADVGTLESMIRNSGFYRQKARRIKNFIEEINKRFGSIEGMEGEGLREILLGIKGIGKETADSILLYALDKPFFVVDAYTLRIFKRYGIIDNESKEKYDEIRQMVENAFEKNLDDLKEFHALLVKLGKDHCRKRPLCEGCPLGIECPRKI